MEANGTPPELIANMMSGMSQGLLMLGEGLETALGDSLAGTPFGPLIATDMRSGSGMYKLPNSPEGHAELCVSLMEEGLSTDPDRRKFESDMFLFGILPNGQFSPVLYTLGPACMLAYSAAQLREGVGSTAAQRAAARAKAMEEVKKIASIVGTEEIDGQPTQHVRVTGISQSQVMEDGTQVTIDQMDVWIDPEYLKRRKFRIEGTMVQNGESRRFFMERENQDYRRVGESFLYEPYLEVMRVGGVLSKEQRAELAEAQKQLAEFDKQLASMPPSQRAMMEKMMGSQMQQMRSLVDGGAVEIRIVTTDIIINPDLRQQGMTTSLGAAPDTSRSLVQMIQTSLATLGYQPGPATGELTKATVVAISRFQAEKGMEVTGQATPQLAGILQAEVEARR